MSTLESSLQCWHRMQWQAANCGASSASYSQEIFLQDFPQFLSAQSISTEQPEALLPEGMLRLLLDQASCAIQPDKWGTQWRLACGLYTAHYATLYLRTYCPQGSENPLQAAENGAAAGLVHSASIGVDSVTFDNSALTASTNPWGSLNATQYGQQLATMARLVGMGGCYVL